MAAVHNERHGNLASFTPEACAASLSQYDQHVKCHCDCADSASTSCEKCKPYSLKKCCRALPHYTEAIKAEVIALQKSRREELEHVTRALSDPAATATASTPAKAAGGAASQTVSSSGVKKAGAAEPTVPPLADSPATPVTGPPAAALPADAHQHADQAVESQVVASCDPVSGVESACAVQLEDLLNKCARGPASNQSKKKKKNTSAATDASTGGPSASDPMQSQSQINAASMEPATVITPDSDSFSSALVTPGIVPVTASAAASVSDQSASRLPPIALVAPAVERGASFRATAISGGDLLSPSTSSLAPAEAAHPPRAVSTAADDSLEGGVVAYVPTAASLAPAEAAALNVLVSIFAAAGMVPSKDYPALSMKLISEGVADEIGLVDMIEEDPDFLKNAGMKAAQRSCLVRHLKRPPAAAGNAAAGGGA
jgi:hypothetical protein